MQKEFHAIVNEEFMLLQNIFHLNLVVHFTSYGEL